MITAVDVGGTKTLIAQFGDRLQPQNELRFETPKAPDQFILLLQQHLSRLGNTEALTLGVPGIVLPDGTVVRCANLPWHDFHLKQRLAELYDCPIYIQNDAKLAALAEINSLSPVPALGLYLTIGTGIGTGIIVDGKLVPALANAEGGHTTIWDGEQWQVWEHVASGRALSAHFGKLVSELSEQNEWQYVADRLALGLYSLIPTFQPQVVVVGGGAGKHFEQFREPLGELLQERISSYIKLPELRGAQHSEEAVLYGAYYYVRHQQLI